MIPQQPTNTRPFSPRNAERRTQNEEL